MNEPHSPSPSPSPISPSAAPANHTWELCTHLAALAGFVFPFGNVAGPLLVWALKKGEVPAVDAHGKEAINFNISMVIYYVIAAILIFLLVGFIILPALALAHIILIVIAAVKAGSGEFYRYPLTIRLIK